MSNDRNTKEYPDFASITEKFNELLPDNYNVLWEEVYNHGSWSWVACYCEKLNKFARVINLVVTPRESNEFRVSISIGVYAGEMSGERFGRRTIEERVVYTVDSLMNFLMAHVPTAVQQADSFTFKYR